MNLSKESRINAKENSMCVCTCVCIHRYVHHSLNSGHMQEKTKSPISTLPTRTHLGHFYSIHVPLLPHVKGRTYYKELLKSPTKGNKKTNKQTGINNMS